MNQPFTATGLGVPWYGIFGNHDSLIQGNQPRNAAFNALATGCVKPTGLAASAQAALEALAVDGFSPAEAEQARLLLDESLRRRRSSRCCSRTTRCGR
ncbi:MAG: hypothetical protein M3376_03210 [Actinomycetota bacterium]|nr:hypothetical protein [Actinomycetota bacterium]